MPILERGDPRYPSVLLSLPRPPDRLFLRGRLPGARMVAVVGTRGPDREGRRFARELGEALARAGVVVVSGGALGVDAAAHQGALDAGRPTVAVLACGLDVPYPTQHRELFDRIAETGGVLSEHPAGTPPRRAYFPERNRIVAALGAATVVVQAGSRSGALITAGVARALGRPVVAVPWSPYEPRGDGTAHLIRTGATFAGSIGDVLRAVGLGGSARASSRRPRRSQLDLVDPVGRAILAALDGGPLFLAEIVEETGLSSEDVVRTVLTLVLEGRIEEIDFQRFGHAPPPGRR